MSPQRKHDWATAPRSIRLQRDECGAEAVEVVFVLPLLVLFVVAILHFGLQMVSAEAFVGKADAAVLALTIDEESVRQADEEALKASANSEAAFSSDSSMSVAAVSIGAKREIATGSANSGSYIPVTYTVACRLPRLFGTGDAKSIKKTVIRRIPVKDSARGDDASKGEASDSGAKQDGEDKDGLTKRLYWG